VNCSYCSRQMSMVMGRIGMAMRVWVLSRRMGMQVGMPFVLDWGVHVKAMGVPGCPPSQTDQHHIYH